MRIIAGKYVLCALKNHKCYIGRKRASSAQNIDAPPALKPLQMLVSYDPGPQLPS